MTGIKGLKPFIDGRWVDGAFSTTIRSPYDGAPVATVQMADAGLMERAIAAGKAAEPRMAALTAFQRRDILHKIAVGLGARTEELAAAICAEAGKPITFARGEVARAGQTFAFAMEEAGRLADTSLDLDAAPAGVGRFGVVRRLPVGLVAAISPFNFPLNLVAHKVAPALAAGCPVVLKPASQTPTSSLLLAEICEAAGVPPGGLNVTPANRTVANALTTDDRFKLLTFTGSAEIGWGIKARSGKKRVVLEMGGNAGVVVHRDVSARGPAELDRIVGRVALGAFAYAGQVCISVQRAFIHRGLYQPFCERLSAFVREKVPYGDPVNPSTICGPMIDAPNAERIIEWVGEAVDQGAKVLVGGTREGNLVAPTVLAEVPRDARIYHEEAFGPVMTVEPYDTLEEAIDRLNASRFGLQAGIFTDSMADLWKAYEGVEVGGLVHNDVPMFRVDQMPYGGVKDSGMGREGGRYAMEDYTERRLLILRPGGIGP